MSHELDESTGKPAIAYFGATPWHGMGTVMQAGQSLDAWIDAASVGYSVVRVPAMAAMPDGSMKETGVFFNTRDDTNALLGWQTHTDRRVEVQPREIFHFINDFVSTDPRFTMEVMGAIKGGTQVWATARFNGALDVAGEQHQAYLLARTGFDGSLATHFQLTVIRAVCNNTLSAAFCDKRALITLRHSTKFDPAKAASQLAAMAQSVDTFKAVGDAMAQHNMASEQVKHFFMECLGIKKDEKFEDLSTRKQNQFREVGQAYQTSIAEGAPAQSAWSCLQAITRYVDHERGTRGGNSESEARFESSQFGSGMNMKGEAMGLLMPLIRDRVKVLA